MSERNENRFIVFILCLVSGLALLVYSVYLWLADGLQVDCLVAAVIGYVLIKIAPGPVD